MTKMRIGEQDIVTANIYEILLDNFPDMIHSVGRDGNIVYANQTASRLLGYTNDELLSMNIKDVYAPEILPAVERGFKELRRDGDKTVESLLRAKDDTRIPVEIRSFSIYDDQGRFVRTFSILRDIRKLKELQHSLVHAGRLAAIGETASGVAHDINNPLTVIVLSADVLLRELPAGRLEEPALRQRLINAATGIRRAASSIERLSTHLRNFSRGMKENHERLDLYDSLSDAQFILSNKLIKTGIHVTSHVKKAMYLVCGCPNQMEQVFINLIANACDAMENRPKRELTLSVSAVERGGAPFWKCDVTDTGGGVPEHLREDIFQSFFTTKEKGKGTGLGLSISRSIVKDHGGELLLESQTGVGSTFSVVLPALTETQAGAGSAPPPVAPASVGP
jgi:PAS domain S-box-containing protein